MCKLILQLLFILTINFSIAYSQVSLHWAQRYNGPGNSNDVPASVVCDNSGNVYVTGESVGSGTGLDYATLMRNSNGDLVWAMRYNGTDNGNDVPLSMTMDGAGNVYVTGGAVETGTGIDIVTIKYSPTGQQLWAAKWNGAGNSDEVGTAVVVDASGNVYVTGSSGPTTDIVTIKYNSAGQQQWAIIYNGSGNGNDYPVGILVDALGNVYVGGQAVGSGTGFDYVAIKYNSAGQQQWASTFNRSAGGNDAAGDIGIDAAGNVYITGTSIGNDSDYVTVKYNSGGQQQWSVVFNGSGNGPDVAKDMVVDPAGNVYVTGSSYSSLINLIDYGTVKYNTSGQQQWVAYYNGPGVITDVANSIVMDFNGGNLYVTGVSYSGSSADYDIATIRYNNSGGMVWAQRYNSPYNSNDGGVDVAVTSNGASIYSAGFSMGSGTGLDFVVVKYTQIVGISGNNSNIPEKFALYDNYPNPFNPSTNIKFDLPDNAFVKLVVFDLTGKEVATLVNNEMQAGAYTFTLSASHLASGVYFYRIDTDKFTETKKMVLVK
jgi:uncharacterized delta-60 repeat protein